MLESNPPPYDSPHRLNQVAFTAAHEQSSPSIQTDSALSSETRQSNAATTLNEKAALDFTQRIERKLAEYNASPNAIKRWLFEILSWLTSAICMGAIVALCIWARNKPMSQVGGFLTYTNVLGKIASAALIVPTSEALGQLKWNWFQESKAMWDFEVFDKASRGPLGAALLLYRTKGRSLAALGALLIVMLLAIDSFFQQVVDLPERWLLQADSAIPRVVNYEAVYLEQYFQGYEMQQTDEIMSSYLKPFFYKNGTQPVPYGNGTRPDIPLSCPTSTCTWPAYETLGVCSECVEASDLLQFKCAYTKIDWSTNYTGPINPEATPNGTVCGYFYDAGKDGSFLMSGYIANDTDGSDLKGEALLVRALPFTDNMYYRPISGGSEKYKHVRNPILDVLIVSSPDSSSVYAHKRPIAQECVVSWCVKTIESAYEAGQYSENVSHSYQNTTSGPFPWESIELPVIDNVTSSFIIYNQNITIERQVSENNRSHSVVSNNVYTVDNVTAANHLVIFGDMFRSYYTDAGPSGTPMLRFKDFWPGAYLRELPFNPWQTPNNVSHHLQRMATAMTNVIRSSESREMVQGAAYEKVIFIHIRWEWLSFPIILLVLSLVFLVATIIKTSGNDATAVWKTSAMPALICSLPKETQSQFASSSTWASGDGAPRKTRIRMLPNMDWRVSGQHQLDSSSRLQPEEHARRSLGTTDGDT